ncbi:MAG: hypothetical protein H3Z52_14225 [archaeon]|nr:hypothetical protein [archaeon]MCP8315751.1 hypothetical protein [archaeon]MCP8322072.1 hypothetical protein [archaeon]
MVKLLTLKVRETLKAFKEHCRDEWEAEKNGQWFKIDNSYHVFVWSKSITIPTLKSMVCLHKVSVRDGDFWKVKDASFMAFISTGGLEEDVCEVLKADPRMTEHCVFYDLEKGIKIGMALSPVFKKFEEFLKAKYGLDFKYI